MEGIPITGEMIEAVRRDRTERCRRRRGPRRYCDRIDEILPVILSLANREQVPVLGAFLVALDGHLLISRRDLAWVLPGDEGAAGPRPYDLVSPAGRYLGRIDVPANFRPLILGTGVLLGVLLDELGVPYVVRYGIAGRS